MKIKIKLSEIMDRLPPEAQKWVNGMNRDEKAGTETILSYVGVDSFIKHWRTHKNDLDYIRNFQPKLIVGISRCYSLIRGIWLHRDCPLQYRSGDRQGSGILIGAELNEPILTATRPKPVPRIVGRIVIEPPKV